MLDFSSCHITVIGDLMLDHYIFGEAHRISPEAPVPIVKVHKETTTPGGAANVAVNLRSLGAKVTLLGLIGEDAAGIDLKQQLETLGITCLFTTVPSHPTIVKKRVLAQQQPLLRLDHEIRFPAAYANRLLEPLEHTLAHTNACIFSDYDKGVNAISQSIITLANQQQKPIIVDPKVADFSVYHGATVVKPNRKEIEKALQTSLSGHASERMQQIDHYRQHLRTQALLVTLGSEGLILSSSSEGHHHLSSHTAEVFDVTGAGDTVIATFTACLVKGLSQLESARIANCAAGLVINKTGTVTVEVSQLNRALYQMPADQATVLQHNTLQHRLTQARSQGETIVMTNGCFDILHSGHVAYLQQAKASGDRLLLAINTDASIKRLKGTQRPINTLADRIAVLANLRAIDWIIAFDDDTPLSLIQRVKPDVLVKGEDYSIDQIVGADFVQSYGGLVKTLTFVEGCSTSATLKKIQSLEAELDCHES